MCLIMALTILEFTADLMVEYNGSLSHWDWDSVLKVFGLSILVVMTLKQTFRPGPVSVHRVMGGVAAYLLIGVTWAFGLQAAPWKRFLTQSTSNYPLPQAFRQVNRGV